MLRHRPAMRAVFGLVGNLDIDNLLTLFSPKQHENGSYYRTYWRRSYLLTNPWERTKLKLQHVKYFKPE